MDWVNGVDRRKVKTVHVSIVVAVDDAGNWSASGSSNYYEEDSITWATKALSADRPKIVHIIRASIPVPEASIIKAKN